MRYSDSLHAIGNTPLIRLKKASELTGCDIYGKAEFMNPGGSVKDRAALSIIQTAIRDGKLNPGGTIVEATAGNTGIGITVVANAMGFKSVIVIPNTQSDEKKATLRAMGAILIEVPPAPFANPNNYQHIGRRLAEQLNKSEPNGAFFAEQFDNVANRQAHIDTTAPEIWQQTEGKVDAFISAVGTGGTLAGTGMGLKERNKDIQIVLADPPGASLYNYYAHGALKAEGTSITEGIGQSRITANLEGAVVDDQFLISDHQSLPITYSLLKDEGLCLGSSSGVNVAGAIEWAKKAGPGKTIVTLLCDSGLRYTSKLFNPEFLRSKDLPVPSWLEGEAPNINIPFIDVAQ